MRPALAVRLSPSTLSGHAGARARRLSGWRRAVTVAGVALLAAVGAQVQARTPDEVGLLELPTLLGVPCMRIPYEPVAVYAEPAGLRIGQLVLDHPEWVSKTLKVSPEKCTARATLQLQGEGLGALEPAKVLDATATTQALAVYETRSYRNQLWVQGRTRGVRFWLPVTPALEYKDLVVQLVQGVALFSETCDPLGRCQPAPDDIRRQVDKAAQERIGECVPYAYEVEQMVTLPGGRKAYQVRLSEELTPKHGTRLPKEALVPTYDYQGRWTGFFNPKGC